MSSSKSVDGLIIRNAHSDEFDVIRALTVEAYAGYERVVAPPMWKGYTRQMITTLDEDRIAERIVAEKNGIVMGSVMLFPAAMSVYGKSFASQVDPEVRLLAVSSTARGQGIGEALMLECERRARAAGAEAISLHTMHFMEPAIRLYTRLGFSRAPETDFEPAPGFIVQGFRLRFTNSETVDLGLPSGDDIVQ